jgi:hypothetical protein
VWDVQRTSDSHKPAQSAQNKGLSDKAKSAMFAIRVGVRQTALTAQKSAHYSRGRRGARQGHQQASYAMPLAALAWSTRPSTEEVFKDEPTLAPIERAAAATAHKLTGSRDRTCLSAYQGIARTARRAGERLGLWQCQRFYVWHKT